MKVTIVGVGALGSHVVQALRNEDCKIKVIDFDRVERKNTKSQFHFVNTPGKKKVDALMKAMAFCYAKRIETISNKLTVENCIQILGDADLLIDCLDNGPSRRIVQEFAKMKPVACLHGALAADGGFGRAIWTDDFVIDEAASGAVTCEDGEFLPFIQLTSSLIAMSAQRFIREGAKVGFSISPTRVERV